MSKAAPILPRGLSILAAVCFVGAASLAILYPPFMSLNRLLFRISHEMPASVQEMVRGTFGEDVWRWMAVPLLTRPCWLLPLSAAIVFAGLAFTFRSRSGVSGQPRLRN